jgi:hypothetical protein
VNQVNLVDLYCLLLDAEEMGSEGGCDGPRSLTWDNTSCWTKPGICNGPCRREAYDCGQCQQLFTCRCCIQCEGKTASLPLIPWLKPLLLLHAIQLRWIRNLSPWYNKVIELDQAVLIWRHVEFVCFCLRVYLVYGPSSSYQKNSSCQLQLPTHVWFVAMILAAYGLVGIAFTHCS